MSSRARRVDTPLLLLALLIPLAVQASPLRALYGGPIKVCIDPGHGGGDPGAVGNGLLEKDVNLDVALRLRDLLVADTLDASDGGAWDVLLTREIDIAVSLPDRVALANGFPAASFCSIHSNAFANPAANGTETYSESEGTAGALLRNRVQQRMLEAWQLTDRGTKTAGFYVLVNTTMPAALTEMGFVTSPIDAQKLADPAARQQAAMAHLFALQEFHGVPVYDPTGSTGTLRGRLLAAGSGAPIAGGTVALADGRFTTSASDGRFSFLLAPGAHALAGTAPGRAVAADAVLVPPGDVALDLTLPAADLPPLTVSVAGGVLNLALGGDVGAPVWIAMSAAPGIPPVALGDKGTWWPSLTGLTLVPVGLVPPGGTLPLSAALPDLPGVVVHLQGVTGWGGALRLSNGAAFAIP